MTALHRVEVMGLRLTDLRFESSAVCVWSVCVCVRVCVCVPVPASVSVSVSVSVLLWIHTHEIQIYIQRGRVESVFEE